MDIRTAATIGQATKTAISTSAGVTKNRISSRWRHGGSPGRRVARRISARRATACCWSGAAVTAAPRGVTVSSLLLVGSLLSGVHDVLRGCLAREEQRDLVVHGTADRRAERRVEVQLHVRRG